MSGLRLPWHRAWLPQSTRRQDAVIDHAATRHLLGYPEGTFELISVRRRGFEPPIDKQSAGRAKTASTGKGNPWLAGALSEIVAGLARTDTFLSDRYRRLARRRGKKRAIVAVGNSVLTIIWHLLSDPDTRYHDLGPSYHDTRINQQRRQYDLIR